MKSRIIGGAVIVAIGALFGMILAYLTSNSLAGGMVLGTLVGLYFGMNFALPGGSLVSNGPPDMHE